MAYFKPMLSHQEPQSIRHQMDQLLKITAEFYVCQTLLKVKTERAQDSSTLPMRLCLPYLHGCLTVLSDRDTFFPSSAQQMLPIILPIAAGCQLWEWTVFSPQGGASEGPEGGTALTPWGKMMVHFLTAV